MGLKAKRPLLAAVLSAVVALVSGVTMVGHPAHLVGVLTLFAGGFGAGAGVAAARAKSRRGPSPDPPPQTPPVVHPLSDRP